VDVVEIFSLQPITMNGWMSMKHSQLLPINNQVSLL
jgi:hypothetical protein